MVAPSKSSDSTDAFARAGRVLLIDDEEMVRVAYRRVLEAAGLVVDAVEDGQQALAQFEHSQYDAILTDCKMPKLSGLDFLRAVRTRDLDVPVLMMTGQPSVEEASKAVEFGILKYLLKPVDSAELQSTVTRAVKLHRMTLAKLQAAELTGGDPVRPTDTMGLQARLDSALASIWLAFQPVVRAADGSIYGYEALLRSSEPALSSPGAVLEAAKRLDRLYDVGRIVRARAAEAIEPADSVETLFINVHPRDLFDDELIDRQSPLTAIASRIVLEINERAVLGTGEAIRERVSALRSTGYRLAIDDLGGGYSGLSSFALLEPELVKLDISLVRGVHANRTKQRLIRSMTKLAKDLNIMTVAEGVEHPDERAQLIELGCDLLQGYLFGNPRATVPALAR